MLFIHDEKGRDGVSKKYFFFFAKKA